MKLLRSALIFIATLMLAACGGGGGGGFGPYDINLTGSVGDGPIVSATVTIMDSQGNVITTQVSDANANYSVQKTSGKNVYPLTIVASGGTDLVTGAQPDFILYSTAINPGDKHININPYSTLIYKIAENMGGISQRNIDNAKTIVLDKLNFGLDTRVVPDPIKTTINDSNIAHIVKASETLGEMIRRTRDLAREDGNNVDADDIINIIAADLTDGLLDGNGTAGSDARIAAYANITSAYVNIEAINNRLMVYNSPATAAMDNAIQTTRPGSTQTTADVAITAALLAQTSKPLNAAYAITPDSFIDNLRAQLQTVSADSYPSTIGYIDSTPLHNTEITLRTADTTTLSQFNSVSNDINSPVNSAPTISGSPATSVTANNAYSFTPSASDTDGDSLSFSIANKPAWASFSSSTGTLSGTPTAAGSYSNIMISVSDGTDSASLAAFDITVNAPANNAPMISGSPATSIMVNNAYSFTPSASDADDDTLSFSIANKPVWASFNTSTGALSGTPTTAGSYSNIMISVSDGTDSASLAAFDITVNVPANNAPVISGSPATSITANNAYSFTPNASDADGDSLSFIINNQPSWASFNSATGTLSGTPTNAGSYSNIVISVTDGNASTSLAAFTITVNSPANNAPVINGNPTTSITVNNAYSFTPTASDADGDSLSFSITNKPAWASFNTSTGALSGTPTTAGSYSNIMISVSDGTDSASLAAFSITVNAQTTKTVTVDWAAPTTYTDGTTLPFSDIAGYRVYSGSSPTSLNMVADINDNATMTFSINNVGQGTYYYAVSAYDQIGVESDLSSVVNTTIP